MSSNYRTYDCATNIILTSKNSFYGPYKSLKQRHKSSNKKIQPLHIKIFDRTKKNQKILSRNDRIDLFLQGGNFSETKQLTNKAHNDRSVYKIQKMRKKEEIFLPFRSQVRTNGWQPSLHLQQNQITKALNAEFLNFIHTSEDTRIRNQVIKLISQQNHNNRQKSVENIAVKNRQNNEKKTKIFSQKKKQSVKHNVPIFQKNDQQKLNDNNPTSSENQLQRMNKLNRPLFYLEAKEISHIKADSFIVSQFPSGQIVFGNYFKKTGEIASLTKIMTFYTVFQIAQKFNKNVYQQIVQIDEQAQYMSGTSAQIFVGDVYTVQQLFYGLMLPSGNDAATALAKWSGRILQDNDPTYKTDSKNTEVKTFLKFMNNLAKKCGMKSSKFFNPHGLPHAQSCSNAQDLAILMAQCLKIQLFRAVIKTKKYNCWVDHKGVKHEVIWQNTNKLLRRPNFIGGKTGVTVSAGPCLVSCYDACDKILIIILLRTTKLSRRFKQTRYILGLALSKLDKIGYKQKIKQVLKNDPQLDSDNSDDEQQFNYERTDAKQMAKRNKILTFQM